MTAATPCPVARWAAEQPDGLALCGADWSVTWGEWNASIAGVEIALREMGVASGDHVGLCLPVGRELLDMLVALFRMGAVACPINPQHPAAYRDTLLARLGCKKVFTEPLTPDVARETVDTTTWQLDGPGTIIFTSGSTGEPRAAVLSLGNHLASARRANANIPLAAGDRWLLSLPMHHVAGFGVLFRCLVAGATIALPPEGQPLDRTLYRLGVTHISLVARQLAQLLDGGVLPGLKAVLLGGSAIPPALLDRALARALPIHTSYGMTETASQIAATRPQASREELATSGFPLGPETIRITSEGLIAVNGPSRFLGYWSGGRVEAPFDEAGWFVTGDLGHFDGEGRLCVAGRRDNMFIAGGENIQPEVVERALCALPGVTQAVVVPVPHADFGATPVAFVECAGALDAEALREAIALVLPRFMVPRHFLPWPDDLGAAMKISRAALAQRAAETLRD